MSRSRNKHVNIVDCKVVFPICVPIGGPRAAAARPDAPWGTGAPRRARGLSRVRERESARAGAPSRTATGVGATAARRVLRVASAQSVRATARVVPSSGSLGLGTRVSRNVQLQVERSSESLLTRSMLHCMTLSALLAQQSAHPYARELGSSLSHADGRPRHLTNSRNRDRPPTLTVAAAAVQNWRADWRWTRGGMVASQSASIASASGATSSRNSNAQSCSPRQR